MRPLSIYDGVWLFILPANDNGRNHSAGAPMKPSTGDPPPIPSTADLAEKLALLRRDYDQMFRNLTACQTRCTDLLTQRRALADLLRSAARRHPNDQQLEMAVAAAEAMR